MNEPQRENPGFLTMRNMSKTQISFAVTVKLISAFVFATQIVQSLFYLYPKFQASSLLLLLYRRFAGKHVKTRVAVGKFFMAYYPV